MGTLPGIDWDHLAAVSARGARRVLGWGRRLDQGRRDMFRSR